jgi:dihydrofolate reductase
MTTPRRRTYSPFWQAPRCTSWVGSSTRSSPHISKARPRTLESAEWERTTINRGDLVTEVEKLKSEGDGYIIVTGRSGITRTLLHHDLIDEFRITVFPLLSGQGTREFETDVVGESKQLELVSCKPGTNGVVVLHYRRRR